MLNNRPKREHRQNGLKEQRNTAKRFNKEIIKKINSNKGVSYIP